DRGDEAHLVLGRGGTEWISVLVEEREARVWGHVDQRPHAEAKQDALLDPGVDAPGAAGAALGRADLTPGERGAEFGEQGAVGVVVAVARAGGERLDPLTQRHARRPARGRALPTPPAHGRGSAPGRGQAAAGRALPGGPSPSARP